MNDGRLNDRKLDVLRAIVQDYVQTREPVGSKALVERHNLGVSPATIRNEMAALEDEGYIHQPHTSAGRVPTDKGYRLFVDRLSQVKPLTAAERRAIHTFLDGAVDLDDVVARTVRLLAQITQQVAVVQYPSLSRSTVRHVELVPLTPSRVMLVLITDTGRVEQRIVDCGGPVAEASLADVRARLNAEVGGKKLGEVPVLLAEFPARFGAGERSWVGSLTATLLETVVEQREERIMLAGTANLARFRHDFPDTVYPVLEALEEQVVLLKLLGETQVVPITPTVPVTQAGGVGSAVSTGGTVTAGGLTVRIGHENPHEGLVGTSVVSTGYGRGDDVVAHLGVLGPTRMDYPGMMGAVSAVAAYVGRILAES